MLLHDHQDFDDLVAVVSREQAIDPGLVEKDYWIMHALWGLQQLGLHFELKGGTSLSKGHSLISRFSEDIDILFHPEIDDLPTGRNQNKPAHIEARRSFYDGLSAKITIPGICEVERDEAFDDQRMRSAGIRLRYTSRNSLPEGVKDGSMPQNFLRHYYDVYCLLGDANVQAFIGTEAYLAHKDARFPAADNKVIAENPTFDLSDQTLRDRFAGAYAATSALYYRGQPRFDDILGRIQEYADRL